MNNNGREEHLLQKLMDNPGKWVHIRRPKRKNNLHDKSDTRTRKHGFEMLCSTLKLMAIQFETKPDYFIKVKADS